MMGEWIRSSQDLLLKTATHEFNNESWFAQASYVLTGKQNSYQGVTPRRNFDPKEGAWGAFELGARYSQLAVDSDFFALHFASPSVSAQHADEFTLGLNWYLNRALKLQLNWQKTVFDHPIKLSPGLRDQEDLFLSQFQLNF
jgi:phosphate-selective porin OprO/OprP